MPTYEKCDPAVDEMIRSLLARTHLTRMGLEDLRVSLLWFRAKRDAHGHPAGPPLRLHGYPCAAIVKVVSHPDRALGLGDAKITIDADQWEILAEPERQAMLDHELEHLETRRRKGAVLFDDLSRPKLKVRLHDWQLGGFRVIAERHKSNAIEVQAAQKFAEEHGQFVFPWIMPKSVKAAKKHKEDGGESFGPRMDLN